MTDVEKLYAETYVTLYDVAECVMDSMYSDGAKKVYEHKSDDFKYGALFGMSWAVSNIYAHCPQYKFKEEQEDETTI